MTSAVTVVIADDHPVVRAGMAALLESLPEVAVVAVAADGRQAVKEVVTHRPHVAILDIAMPVMDGLEATREIARVAPATGVLILTMFDDDDALLAAMRAGARGFIVKGAEADEIHRSVHAVAAGEAIFSAGVAQRVLDRLSEPPTPSDPFPELTSREQEVLRLLAERHSNAHIADRLGVSTKTVANHLSTIFAKLHVADRAAAGLKAREAWPGEFGT